MGSHHRMVVFGGALVGPFFRTILPHHPLSSDYAPYTGFIRISSAPLQAALAQLGQ